MAFHQSRWRPAARAQIAGYLSLAMICGLWWSAPATAAITGATRIASGLNQPVFATHAPGDTSRLFVLEKGGNIKIVDLTSSDPNPVLSQPFLTVPTNSFSEGGLLGLAFHPDYQSNGRFFIYVTQNNTVAGSPFSSHIREFTVSSDPNVANPTGADVLSWVQPQGNHNAGWIGFNPAVTPDTPQYLYITSGDGGKQGDPDNNAQRLVDEPLGKILRIDVDGNDLTGDSGAYRDRNYSIPPSNPFVGQTGDDEIWSSGLRNPWRASFDRQTGDFWIGDVGFEQREEINFEPASSQGGTNYAWNRREGLTSFNNGALLPGDVQPVYDYSRPGNAHSPEPLRGRSVTGGYVYRGPDPDLRGQYVFGDFIASRIFQFDPADPFGTAANINALLTTDVGTINSPAAFGEDADGNLYILDFGGEVFRIDTTIQLPGDYDASGVVDQADYEEWVAQFGQTGALAADGNGDGVVDAADYTVWRDNLGRQLPSASLQGALAVPEPSTIVGLLSLALLLAVATWLRRWFDIGATR